MSCIYISIVLNIYTHRASHIYPPYSSYTSIDAYLIISDGLFEHILLFIGRFLLFVLLLFALLCVINCQSNVYMKNKILLLGLFCCSLISAKAQVLLDKGTGKNSFPIVSSLTNAVVCFDGKMQL